MSIFNRAGERLSDTLGIEGGKHRAIYVLTELGKQKVHSYDTEGPLLAILSALDTGGPSDIYEIQRRSGIDEIKCGIIVKDLKNKC